MKKYHVTLIVWFFLTISTILIIKQFTHPADDPALTAKHREYEKAKLDMALQNLPRNDLLWFYGVIAVLSALSSSGLIYVSGVHRAQVKKASVHTYEIGGNKVIIHERDLSVAWQIVTGLTNAEELKAINGGLDKALHLYSVMADVQSRQIQALLGKRGLQPALPPLDTPTLPTTPPHAIVAPVPTFQELLQRGEIAPGKPMILGFEQGVPRRGSFLDIYSAAVAGESGSGKTITLLYLIGSGIVSCGVKFIVIDPHDPHPKALGPKIKPLVEHGVITLATKKEDIFRALQRVEDILDHRISQNDTDTTPVVLVLDELTLLSKMSVRFTVFRVMERISTEGRKCAVYLLASSQTWLAARTGESSVVRDTLTSAFVHRIKPKQANLLLQDTHEVDKVKQLKDAGEVLLCPVNDDSVICRIPYTTERDMQMIAEMTRTGDDKPLLNQVNQAEHQTDSDSKPSIRKIEKATGIPYSALQRYFAKGTPLEPAYKTKFEAYLLQEQHVESVLKSVESGDESPVNQTKVIQ